MKIYTQKEQNTLIMIISGIVIDSKETYEATKLIAEQLPIASLGSYQPIPDKAIEMNDKFIDLIKDSISNLEKLAIEAYNPLDKEKRGFMEVYALEESINDYKEILNKITE